MSACILDKVKNIARFEVDDSVYLERIPLLKDKAEALCSVLNGMKASDSSWISNQSILANISSLDDIAKKVGYESFEKAAENMASASRMNKVINAYIKSIAGINIDYKQFLSNNEAANTFVSLLNTYRTENITDAATSHIIGGITHTLGVPETVKEIALDITANRINYISQHPELNDVYFKYNKLINRVNSSVQVLLNDTKRVANKIYKDTIKNTGLGEQDFYRLFSLMDGGNPENPATLASKLNERFSDNDNAKKVVMSGLNHLMDEFNIINYGLTTEALQDKINQGLSIKSVAGKNSIVGLINDVNILYNDLIGDTNSRVQLEEIELRLMDKLNSFNARKNYVPQKGMTIDESDDLFSITKDLSDDEYVLPSITRMLNAREAMVSSDEDFIGLLNNNMKSFKHLINSLGMLTMVNRMDDILEKSIRTGYFGNIDTAIKTPVYSSARYFIDTNKRILKYNYDNDKAPVKIVRNLAASVSAIPALILSSPASSIRNIMYGSYGIQAEYGTLFSHERDEFSKALSQGNDIEQRVAKAVDEYADKYLISSMVTSDYVSDSDTGLGIFNTISGIFSGKGVKDPLLVKVSGIIRDFSSKLADSASANGFLLFKQLPIKVLAMNGSERFLRNTIKPILFSDIYASIKASGDTKITDDKIQSIIDESARDEFMRLNKAIGDFGSANKSLLFTALDKGYIKTENDAVKLGLAVCGGIMRTAYMFKLVGKITQDLYSRNVVRSIIGASSKITSKANSMTGNENSPFDYHIKTGDLFGAGRKNMYGQLFAAVLGTLFMTYQYLTKAKDRMLPRFGWVASANPADAVTLTALNVTKEMAKLFPNHIDVKPEFYDEVVDDNYRYALGILSGTSLKLGNTDSNVESTNAILKSIALNSNIVTWGISQFKSAGDVISANANYSKLMRNAGTEKKDIVKAYFEGRAGIVDAIGSTANNDPLNIVSKILSYANIEQVDDEQKQYLRQYNNQFFNNITLSLVGLSATSAPEFYKPIVEDYEIDYELKKLKRNLLDTDDVLRIQKRLTNYGNFTGRLRYAK